MNRETKIQATLLLMAQMSKREIAEFIVDLEGAVEGLRKNNDSYVNAYRRILEKYGPSILEDEVKS